MKNITVSLDDEAYRQARIKAAAMDTSVSALVRAYLQRLSSEDSLFDKLEKEEDAIRERITNFSASDRLSREELYPRGKLS